MNVREQYDICETWLDITGIEGAQGKEGPEWKLHGRWPWTPARNVGGDQVWINRAKFPNITIDTRGRHAVEVRARGLKRQSDAKRQETGQDYYNGSFDWMWQWDIIQFLDREPVQTERAISIAGPAGTAPAQNTDLDLRIAWNSAVNNAVHLHGPDKTLDLDGIRAMAAEIYQIILDGPPTQDTPDDPVAAIEDVPEAKPITGADAVRHITQQVKFWNTHHDSQLGRAVVITALSTLYGIAETDFRIGIGKLSAEQVADLAEKIGKGTLPADVDSKVEEMVF